MFPHFHHLLKFQEQFQSARLKKFLQLPHQHSRKGCIRRCNFLKRMLRGSLLISRHKCLPVESKAYLRHSCLLSSGSHSLQAENNIAPELPPLLCDKIASMLEQNVTSFSWIVRRQAGLGARTSYTVNSVKKKTVLFFQLDRRPCTG